MTVIKVNTRTLRSASEELGNISSEVYRLNRDYFDAVSNLEMEIRDCHQVQRIADRLYQRVEEEQLCLQRISDFLLHAADEYLLLEDTSSIPDHNEKQNGVSVKNASDKAREREPVSGQKDENFFDHIPILESLEKLYKYYSEIFAGEGHSTTDQLENWWQAFNSSLSLWKDLYSEMEKIWKELEDLPVGEAARWIPVVNVISGTGLEWHYWYNEYIQDGEYSGDEILKTLIYASTNGLMHVGTDLMDIFSGGIAIPESVVFDEIIDGGGSRELAEGLMEAAENTGKWIGELIVKIRGRRR